MRDPLEVACCLNKVVLGVSESNVRACHGAGDPGPDPMRCDLAGSDFILKRKRPLCIARRGTLTVNGQTQRDPGMNVAGPPGRSPEGAMFVSINSTGTTAPDRNCAPTQSRRPSATYG